MISVGDEFHWVPFYEALADKLLVFKDKRGELFNVIRQIASEQQLMKHFISKTKTGGDHVITGSTHSP